MKKLGAEYQILFENFSSEFPKNMKFEVDGKAFDINTGFSNRIEEKGLYTHTINWYWDYDEKDEYIEKDISDITFDITISASQLREEIRTVLPKTGF